MPLVGKLAFGGEIDESAACRLLDMLSPFEQLMSRITVDPLVHFGKPCVAGTRIPVQNVLELVREGVGFDAIVRDYYRELSPDDVRACVQYAMDVLAAEDLHLSASP